MVIECDTRQQKEKHIIDYFDRNEIKYVRNKLYTGDYKRTDSVRVIIDTKKDLVELAGNLCRTVEHERIKREIEKAREIGCERLVFLVADERVRSTSEVGTWNVTCRSNGTKYTNVKPETLQKIMETIEERYPVKFLFTKKKKWDRLLFNY